MKKNITLFEKIWYILTGGVALWGLTYIVLGLVASFADVPQGKNALAEASEKLADTFGLGFFGWGLIILAIGVVAAVIVLLIFAAKVDRTTEKAARRAARLAKIEADMASNNQ